MFELLKAVAISFEIVAVVFLIALACVIAVKIKRKLTRKLIDFVIGS